MPESQSNAAGSAAATIAVAATEGSRATRPLDLEQYLPAVLRHLTESMAANLTRRYEGELKLTATELRIVLHLAQDGALNAAQIVVKTAMEKSKVSRAVTQLQKAGFVERSVSMEDQRSKTLTLTERGQRLYANIVPRLLEWENDLIADFGAAEYRDLMALLGRLQTRVDSLG